MKKIVGRIKSKSTDFLYFISHDQQSQTAWISQDQKTWWQVCENVSEKFALECAQRYIDGQPNLF